MLGILDSMKKFRFNKKISTLEKNLRLVVRIRHEEIVLDSAKIFSTQQKYSRLEVKILDSMKNSRPLLSIIACHSTYRVGIYSCKTFKPLAVFFFSFFIYLFILSTKGIVITSQRLHAIAFDSRHVVLPGMQNSSKGRVPPLRYQW